jgi:hypothetical protein
MRRRTILMPHRQPSLLLLVVPHRLQLVSQLLILLLYSRILLC